MEANGRQSRLLTRLIGRLRGDHHRQHQAVGKSYSVPSTVSAGCNSTSHILMTDEDSMTAYTRCSDEPGEEATTSIGEEEQFTANADLRYSGQYLTPEQLPEFCDQLRHLVEVIRNIQSYATVTGEYPAELERRLEQEAREVAALASEAQNARDVVSRTRTQRRAVRAQRRQLVAQLATLRESEVRELESTVRLSDRRLYKSWEALKDSSDPTVFEPLLDEIRNKQAALECLVRLIDTRRSSIARNIASPRALPPPTNNGATSARRRAEAAAARRGTNARRRGSRTHRPLSEDASHGNTTSLVTTARHRSGTNSAALLQLPRPPSSRDIVFFTAT
ncbi:hypothetical protein JYU34_004881 [Plutella xylostella]|uniref:Uncharacterized protein n=1 Tax=Plutella xylostella TaxID=51655 RepID=A0ABQ7QVD8_PLUXY|nr:uncharacterized protein LOC105394617 [Plutella xylostella]KAG7309017.1 hypothetical protein JYU34_004881 [Plutella xylostella]